VRPVLPGKTSYIGFPEKDLLADAFSVQTPFMVKLKDTNLADADDLGRFRSRHPIV
jgi:hypothetical protein